MRVGVATGPLVAVLVGVRVDVATGRAVLVGVCVALVGVGVAPVAGAQDTVRVFVLTTGIEKPVAQVRVIDAPGAMGVVGPCAAIGTARVRKSRDAIRNDLMGNLLRALRHSLFKCVAVYWRSISVLKGTK